MKKPATPAIKSQLEAMQGKVAVVAPQSAVARLVHGEIKGGEAKQAFVLSVVRDAILQAYKGNTRDIPEAMKLCEGKAIKAKAFYNGFTAIAGTVEKVAYVGKFDSAENATVRADVMQKTEAAILAFKGAYLGTFEQAKTDAQKKREAKKAAAAAPASTDSTDSTDTTDDAPAPAIAPTFELDIAPTVDAIVDAIRGGLLSAEELTMLRAALAMADESTEAEAAPLALAA